jgi:hypothetical protein
MNSPLITAVLCGAATAGLTAAICFLYGGGGVAIPGAVAILAVNTGLVGFVAGLIARSTGKPSKS